MLDRSKKSNKTGWPRFPILIICLILFTGCTDSNTQKDASTHESIIPSSSLEKRFDEVRAIHDEVMPNRGKLIRLQRAVAEADLTPDLTAFAKTRLETADDMMMNWMYADIPLSTLVDSLQEPAILSYLNTREQEIKDVADSMMTSIQFAESILAQ